MRTPHQDTPQEESADGSPTGAAGPASSSSRHAVLEPLTPPPARPSPRAMMTTITTSAIVAAHTPSSAITQGVAAPAPTPGQLLRLLRRHAVVSQRELAERLGYSQQQVSLWEHDIHSIPIEIHQHIATLLHELIEERQQLLDMRNWPTIGRWRE